MRNGVEKEHGETPTAQFLGQDEPVCNTVASPTLLTICVTSWNTDTHRLLSNLTRQQDAGKCGLIVFDNGSNDPELTQKMARQIQDFPGPARLVRSRWRLTQRKSRRRLAEIVDADWILFLDANVGPDKSDFLTRYINIANTRKKPALYTGGRSLKYAPKDTATALHAAHVEQFEFLPADQRAGRPGPNVFETNILVHREIVETVDVKRDSGDWGWDYVDWGLSVSRKFRVEHIDNTVSAMDLSDADELMRKYVNSGQSYARAVSQYRQLRKRRLFRAAKTLSYLPFSRKVETIAASVVRNENMPLNVRLFGLRVFRAATYAEYV